MIVVVPCFNEAERLDIHEFARAAPLFDAFVLVDDGSDDHTNDTLTSLQTAIEENGGKAFVHTLPANVGKGEAIREGIRFRIERLDDSTPTAIVDADLSTPFVEIARLGQVLDANAADLLQGARVQILGNDIRRSKFRHYIGRVGATLIGELLKIPLYDTQAGAKIFSTRALQAGLFDDPFESRWLFDCELFLRAAAAGLTIREEPLRRWHDRPADSKVNAAAYLRSLVDLFRIRQRYRAAIARSAWR